MRHSKHPTLTIRRRRVSLYGPFVIFRATKGGGLVLKEESSAFRNINGFMLTLGRRTPVRFEGKGQLIQVMFVFRRKPF